MEDVKDCWIYMLPTEWWEMFGDETLELKKFVIRVLNLTYSSSRYVRN